MYKKLLLPLFMLCAFTYSSANSLEKYRSILDKQKMQSIEAQDKKLNTQTEVKAKRTETSKTFAIGESKEAVYTTAGALHYKEANQWQLVHTNFIPFSSKADYSYSSPFNQNKLYIGNAQNKVLLQTHTQDELVFGTNRTFAIQNQGQNIASYNAPANASFELTQHQGEATIYYSNIFQQIDSRYIRYADGFKQEYILNNASVLPAQFSQIIFSETIEVPQGFVLSKTINNDIENLVLMAKENAYEVTFSPILIYDDRGEETYGKYQYTALGNNQYKIDYIVENTWLQDSTRVFPIVIDPQITITVPNLNWYTGTVDEDGSLTNYCTTGPIKVGMRDWDGAARDHYHGAMKFDITAVPDNACVYNASLRLYQYNFVNARNDDNNLEFTIGSLGVDPVTASCPDIHNAIQTATTKFEAWDVWSSSWAGPAGANGFNDYDENSNGWKSFLNYGSNTVAENYDTYIQNALVSNNLFFGIDNYSEDHADVHWPDCGFWSPGCGQDNDERIEFSGHNSAEKPHIIIYYDLPLAVAVNPQGASKCAGETHVFSAGGVGGGAYNYQWQFNNGSGWSNIAGATNALYTLNPIANADSGMYRCRVYNFCNSEYSLEANLDVRKSSTPATSLNVSEDTICAGGNTQLSVVGGSLGYGAEWKWYANACGGVGISVGAGSTIVVSPNTTTTYYARAEGLCGATICRQIQVNVQSPPPNPVPNDAVVCSTEDVILTAYNVNGTLTWYSDAALTTVLGTGTPLNIGTQAVGVYNYYAQVVNAKCTTTAVSNTITVEAVPNAPSVAGATICAGQSALLSTSVSSNTIRWYADAALSNLLYVGTAYATPVLNTTTQYWVTASSANCESTATAVTVTVNALPTTPTLAPQTICMGATASLTPTTSGGTITWYADALLQNLLHTGSTFTTPNLYTNTIYYIVESDGTCQSNIGQVVVNVNPTINAVIDSVNNASCANATDGEIYVSVNGGTAPYTYLWSNSATTQNLANLGAGTYTLTITDANSCTATLSASVTEPSALTISTDIVQNVSCFGGNDAKIEVSIAGGTAPYTYQWSDGTNIIATSKNLQNVATGTYTLTVTDANACTQVSMAYNITEPAQLQGNISTTDVLCFGGMGSASVTATGGTAPYTYLWSNFDNTANNTNIPAGEVSVIITDANGCSIQLFDTIQGPTQALEAMVVSTQAVTCFGSTDGAVDVAVSGGTTPYTYLWSNNATTEDLNGVAAGTYTLTITDGNACTTTIAVEIESPAAMISTMAVTDAKCYGEQTGSIVVGCSGGTAPYIYNWNTTPAQTGVLAVNLEGDKTYTVTITDANGCIKIDSAMVNQPVEMSITTEPTSVSCLSSANGKVSVSVQGGAQPLQYELNGFLQADSVFDNLDVGNYIVFVEDNKGCTAEASFAISGVSGASVDLQGAGNDLNFVSDNLYIVRGEAVSLNAEVLNGNNPITAYNWTPSAIDATSSQQTPVFSPTDNVTITVEVLEDINGDVCAIFDTLKVFVSQEKLSFVPNAFSPNNQGQNNFFEINVLGAKNLNVQIFDRWGEMVFNNPTQTNGPNNVNDPSLTDGSNPRGAWDGKYKGEDAPTGTYVYQIEVTYFDDTKETLSGTLTLIR